MICVVLLWYFAISSLFNMTVTACWKHLVSFLLIGFIAAFLHSFQSGEYIYDPPIFGLISWHYNTRFFIHLKFLIESKIHFTISCASWLIMISMQWRFECITRSSALSLKKSSRLLLFIEFSICQVFWNYF